MKKLYLASFLMTAPTLSTFAAGAKAPAGSWECMAKGRLTITRPHGPNSTNYWSGFQKSEIEARTVALRKCQRDVYGIIRKCEIVSCHKND